MSPPVRVKLNRPLTRMERVVIDLVGPGYSYQQVALALGLSTRTVRMHCERAALKIPGTIPCLPRVVYWWQGYSVEALFAYAHGRRLNAPPVLADAECRRKATTDVAPSRHRLSARGASR